MESRVVRFLVEEATKKSGLIWVRGTDRARPLWHVWLDGAAYVVGGGPGEQPLPAGLTDGARAEVTVPSKDKRGRVVSWTAEIGELAPGSGEWTAAVAELKGKRLNAPDGEAAVERWRRECRVLRLAVRDARADLPAASLAARPVPSPATTRGPLPPAFGLRRRRKG
ncbi:hypothetical protein [Streptomyces sp. 8L]|uniref:hypothetical protein n=1 Tax=Streptomyces sp. 8L TaxID=2877242 RepID=UPI001CD5616C|nr:hypothetical protein [Streptomyces sp. 8L]MCA1217722.1 hypothetical protein [Streptomyces sp. 8L]